MDIRDNIHAVDRDSVRPLCPQRSVEDGSVLGGVDALADKHRLDAVRKSDPLGERHQQFDGVCGHEMLGQIDNEVAGSEGQAVRPSRILLEETTQVEVTGLSAMRQQGRPFRSGTDPSHRFHLQLVLLRIFVAFRIMMRPSTDWPGRTPSILQASGFEQYTSPYRSSDHLAATTISAAQTRRIR